MKKKLRKQACETDGEEDNYKIPEYVTAINIFSKDQLNITLSKCGIVMLGNLGQVRHVEIVVFRESILWRLCSVYHRYGGIIACIV